MVTLLHFTHPLWLEDRGGFESEDAPAAFLAFARRVYREFGGKVGWRLGAQRGVVLFGRRLLFCYFSWFGRTWVGVSALREK